MERCDVMRRERVRRSKRNEVGEWRALQGSQIGNPSMKGSDVG